MPQVLVNSGGDYAGDSHHVIMLRDAGFDVRVIEDKEFVLGKRSDQEEIATLSGASATPAGGERYTAHVIESLPDLRVIARLGVGFDRVDLHAATERGVVVTITPTANHEAVAEHALALILAVAKSIVPADREMRSGGWASRHSTALRGRTLGIVGLGRIGRSLAILAQGLGMRVIAAEVAPDRSFVEERDIQIVDLDFLLETADYVSLHCPLDDDTRGIINADRLARMKQDAVLVNTARGGLLVEADLVEALSSSTIGGAALDVFEQEATAADNPLFKLDNVIVSPHVAGNDDIAVESMHIEAAQCVIDLSRGVWPDGAVVNGELKGHWRW